MERPLERQSKFLERNFELEPILSDSISILDDCNNPWELSTKDGEELGIVQAEHLSGAENTLVSEQSSSLDSLMDDINSIYKKMDNNQSEVLLEIDNRNQAERPPRFIDDNFITELDQTYTLEQQDAENASSSEQSSSLDFLMDDINSIYKKMDNNQSEISLETDNRSQAERPLRFIDDNFITELDQTYSLEQQEQELRSELGVECRFVKASDIDMSYARGINENFWEYKSVPKEDYLRLASGLPKIQEALSRGEGIANIKENPALQETWSVYFEPRNMVILDREPDGTYFYNEGDRHYLMAARELGYDIPVRVIEQNDVAEQFWDVEKNVDVQEFNELIHVNPNYHEGPEWWNNCQRCVPTYEMRLRGYDVTAKPCLDGSDHLAYYPYDAWINPNILSTSGTGQFDIEEKMAEWGDGARAQVTVEYKDGVVGHTFSALQIDGQTYFVDPQDSSEDTVEIFNDVKHNRTQFCRIDNLRVSDLIERCCEKRRSI